MFTKLNHFRHSIINDTYNLEYMPQNFFIGKYQT